MTRSKLLKKALWASLLLLSACSAVGPQVDPLKRKATWFSYLSGSDIKAHCRPGAKDYYRFIYNGVYQEQVRSYDFQANDNNVFMLTHITGDPYLHGHKPDWGVHIGNLWEGVSDKRKLDHDALLNLTLTLKKDGFETPNEGPVKLISSEFYWVVQACEDGRYHFKAWRAYGNVDQFKALNFPKALMVLDRTGIPFNPWRELPNYYHVPQSPEWGQIEPFVLVSDADGLNYYSLDDLLN